MVNGLKGRICQYKKWQIRYVDIIIYFSAYIYQTVVTSTVT